jgi:hypothetical protein
LKLENNIDELLNLKDDVISFLKKSGWEIKLLVGFSFLSFSYLGVRSCHYEINRFYDDGNNQVVVANEKSNHINKWNECLRVSSELKDSCINDYCSDGTDVDHINSCLYDSFTRNITCMAENFNGENQK